MSISLASVTVPYIGQPFSTPANYCGVKGFLAPIQINWATYFATVAQSAFGIVINLSLGSEDKGGILSSIKSVKIDNTSSTVPIYVYFPDTQDVIACPPQTVVFLPVLTNARTAIIFTEGLTAGFLPTTRIWFCDFIVMPYIDPALQIVFPQEKGSPAIQRNQSALLTPGYAAPALGDQTQQLNIDTTTSLSVTSTPLFGTPLATGFIYLTGIEMVISQAAPNGQYCDFWATLASSGASGILYQWGTAAITLINQTRGTFLLHRTPGHMNLRLDATEAWSFNMNINHGASGGLLVILNYTYNPS